MILGYLIMVSIIIKIPVFIFGETYSKKDLISNYEHRKHEIKTAKDFIYSVTPPGYSVHIEYRSRKKINFSIWERSDTTQKKAILWFREWDINPYNYKKEKERSEYEIKYGGRTNSLDLVMKKLKWNEEVFLELKKYLDKANCISITANRHLGHCTIGFQRSLMGLYSYVFFDNLSPLEIKKNYNDGCIYSYYRENIVLQYGGGAIGPQCFEDYKSRTVNE